MNNKAWLLAIFTVFNIQSKDTAIKVADLINEINTVMEQKLKKSKKTNVIQAKVQEFVAKGGNLNQVCTNCKTNQPTTALGLCAIAPHITLLLLETGANPLCKYPKTSITTIEYFIINPPKDGHVASSLHIINIALLMSYIPKESRKAIFDSAIKHYMKELELRNHNDIDDWFEDFFDDCSDLYENYKEIEEISDLDSHDVLEAISCLKLEAYETLFDLYLDLLPKKQQEILIKRFSPLKRATKSLQSSKWWNWLWCNNLLTLEYA